MDAEAEKELWTCCPGTEVDKGKRLQIQWVPIDLSNPNVDLEGAVKCGTDHEGYETYVARAHIRGAWLPSYFVPETNWLNNCHTEIELLILRDCEFEWVHAENGAIPTNALKTGYDERGDSFYTGRAIFKNRLVLGKINRSWGCLLIPNKEFKVRKTHYEVLVVWPKAQAEQWDMFF
ncbi:uncharacterized protein LOC117787506 [Drosophila innubila]|uniref:uncharacterized protein LOC117787506 n=1 Tax=Drosophila innubila TaxID=198719 RepID=UPI00148B8AFB|nr:uncharacterized protein LOC117787506 [Drosophila innubila]